MREVIEVGCFLVLALIALIQSVRLTMYKSLAEDQDELLKKFTEVTNIMADKLELNKKDVK